MKNQKDFWDKLPAIAALLASVFVPLAVTLVGSMYSAAIKDSENRVRYVELAVSILRMEPNSENAALRSWAVDILDRQSTVPLPAEARKQLNDTKVQWIPQLPQDYRYKYDAYTNPNVDYIEYGGTGKPKPSTPVGPTNSK